MDVRSWSKQLPADVRDVLNEGTKLGAPVGTKAAVWSALSAKLPAAAGVSAAVGTGASTAGGLATVLKSFAVGLALGAVTATTTVGIQHATTPAVPTAQTLRPNPSVQPGAQEQSPFRTAPATVSRLPRPSTATSAPAPLPTSSALSVATQRLLQVSPTTNVGPLPSEEPPRSSEHAVLLESRQVARVRALLQQGRANSVLIELEQLDRQTPRGVLIQERETLRIQALSILGHHERARDEASRFITRHPQSPHRSAIERALQYPSKPLDPAGRQ